MPDTATITTFITMEAGTKARATHVNTNFSVFRGHILPVDPNTQTSAHNTYDFGAADAYWRNAYFRSYPVLNGDASPKIQIETVYDGSSPAEYFDDIAWLSRTGFPKTIDTDVRFQFRVPAEYTPGNRISIGLRGYCETSPSAFVMESVAALYKSGVDDASLTTPANRLTSTVSIVPTTGGLLFYDSTLRISDSSGRINLLTITAGDVISVSLKRRGSHASDTNTGYYFLTELAVELNT